LGLLDRPWATAQSLPPMSPPGDPQTVGEPIVDTPPSWLAALLAERRPLVMGILNVTPDSFSDGGRFIDPQTAIERARRMMAEGADIIDIGAESTRPYGGAKPVSEAEERARLEPVLPAVVKLGIPVSIDTMKAAVASWALDQGAGMVNDVWGLQRDPDMAQIVSEYDMPVVIMHNRAEADPALDIIAEVQAFFARSIDAAKRVGVARDCMVLDPGIGFGKTAAQSMACIAQLSEFKRFGLPLLVGASRKRFIDKVTPAPPDQRIGGSISAHLMAAANGAAILRVHDVAETVQALRVKAALEAAR
jgi:dihydropteroate synthase